MRMAPVHDLESQQRAMAHREESRDCKCPENEPGPEVAGLLARALRSNACTELTPYAVHKCDMLQFLKRESFSICWFVVEILAGDEAGVDLAP